MKPLFYGFAYQKNRLHIATISLCENECKRLTQKQYPDCPRCVVNMNGDAHEIKHILRVFVRDALAVPDEQFEEVVNDMLSFIRRSIKAMAEKRNKNRSIVNERNLP